MQRLASTEKTVGSHTGRTRCEEGGTDQVMLSQLGKAWGYRSRKKPGELLP